MHIVTSNINTALKQVLEYFTDHVDGWCIKTNSRNGIVLRLIEPLTITYERPWQRVLFNPVRNCNPFFHVAESLWMLAGRNDVKFLDVYNSRMKEYSDDGETFRASYGHRWSRGVEEWPMDQVESCIKELKESPNSRRAVVSLWQSQDSSFLVLRKDTKDYPCNTTLYVQILNGHLELTICNRSNDLLWGMLGANAVHFSFLQEYIALRLGLPIGRMHQFSTNVHVYTDTFPVDMMEKMKSVASNKGYGMGAFPHYSLLPSEDFNMNIRQHLDSDKHLNHGVPHPSGKPAIPFITNVWNPMARAWQAFKDKTNPDRHHKALELLSEVQAADWKTACIEYVTRRQQKYQSGNPYFDEA